MKSVPPDKRQPPRGTAALVGFLVGAIVFACIPARIISEGYFPSDDALRHAAHAVSGRAWDEVMLLAPGFDSVMDTHPGWHRLLRLIHELSGPSAGGLVYLPIHLAFLAVPWRWRGRARCRRR